MVTFTDTFDGDGAVSANWQAAQGSWSRVGGLLRNTSGSGVIAPATANLPTGQAQFAQVDTIAITNSGKVVYLRLRMNAAGTDYFACRVSGANASIRRAVSSSQTTLSTYTHSRALPETYRFEVEGSAPSITLRLYVNGSLVLTVNTDTDVNSGAGQGVALVMGGSGSNNDFDNWSSGDLVAGSNDYPIDATVPVTSTATGTFDVVSPEPGDYPIVGTTEVYSTALASFNVVSPPGGGPISGAVNVLSAALASFNVVSPPSTSPISGSVDVVSTTSALFTVVGPPPEPGAGFTDDFNRADGAVGADWQVAQGSWAIASNELSNTSGSGVLAPSNDNMPATQDQYVQVDNTYLPGTSKVVSIRARMNTTGLDYFSMRVSSGNISIRRAVGGSETTLATYSYARATPETYRFEVEGSAPSIELRGYLNGTLVVSVTTDTDITAGAGVALVPSGSGSPTRFDNWSSGDLEAAPPSGSGPIEGTVPITSVVSAMFTITGGPGPGPSGGLTQATMPTLAEAWTLAPAPTMSVTSSSTISGGTLVLPTNSAVKTSGWAETAPIAQVGSSGYWRPPFLADVASPTPGTEILPHWGIGIRVTASQVELKIRQRADISSSTSIGWRMAIRIRINGRWTSERPRYISPGAIGFPTLPANVNPGTEMWVKLDFGSSATRDIWIDTMSEVGGFVIPGGATLGSLPEPSHVFAMIGDSMTGAERHGIGNFSLNSPTENGAANGAWGTYSNLSSLVNSAAWSIGYDSIVNSAAGSSGFTRDGDAIRYTDPFRLSQVIAAAPEIVLVGTSFNDIQAGVATATVNAAADNVLSTLRAGLPDAILVILGNPTPPVIGNQSAGSAMVAPYNLALKQSAVDNGAWFIDPDLGTLYNPSGVDVYDTTNLIWGPPDRTSYISSDQQHPTQTGAQEFGKILSQYLRLAHPAGDVPIARPFAGTVTITSTASAALEAPPQAYPIAGLVAVVSSVYGFFTITGSTPPAEVVITYPTLVPALQGHRAEGYYVELLSSSGNTLAYLDGVTGMDLKWNSLADLQGSGSIQLLDTTQDINFSQDRVRLWWSMAGQNPWPLGKYVMSVPETSYTSFGRAYDVTLLDVITVMQEDVLLETLQYPAGVNVVAAAVAQVQAAGEMAISATPSATVLTNALTWSAGTPRLTVINDLLAIAGYWALWTDRYGTFRVDPYVPPASRTPSFTFEEGELAIHTADWQYETSLWNTTNTVVYVSQADDDGNTMTAYAINDDPASPTSTVSLGRPLNPIVEENVEASSQEDLQNQANLRLLNNSSVFGTLTVSHLPLPLWYNDTVRFKSQGVDTLASVWKMEWPNPGGLVQATWRSA